MSAAPGGVDLGLRLGGMQLTRVLIVTVAVIDALVRADVTANGGVGIVAVAVLYVVASSLLEVGRKLLRRRGGATAMLLVLDVLLMGAMTAVHGSPLGPAGFLPHVHVVAVALLISPPAALATATAHVAVLFGLLTNELTGSPTEGIEADYATAGAGVILVAGAVSLFTWMATRENRRKVDQLHGLAGLAAACHRASSTDEIRDALLDSCTTALGYERGVVLVGLETEHTAEGAALMRTVRGRDPELDAVLGPATNVVVLPLRADGGSLGTCALVWPESMISTEIVAVTERFCDHAALAIHNLQLRQELQGLADTDGLTGLANRRRFDQALHDAHAMASRYGVELSVALVDIDHFKRINDEHGHSVGDDVLRHVGSRLHDVCRASDLPARFGGEEFVVLLPGTGHGDAVRAALRIRTALGDRSGPVPITVSVGVATRSALVATVQDLLVAADRALYRAKQTGRNRVCAADDTSSVAAPGTR